jgi:hypothetical protein
MTAADGRTIAVTHPACWEELLSQFFRQETGIVLTVAIGNVEDLYAGLFSESD